MNANRCIRVFARRLQPEMPWSFSTHSCRRPQLIPAPRLFSTVSRTNPPTLLLLNRPHFMGRARHNSSATTVPHASYEHDTPAPTLDTPPAYELTFTCKPCQHRSTHTVSKQGYHKGTVLVECPGCNNRHAISDHLKMFADQAFTVEDLMRQNGERVKRGHLGEGDVEFWDDGSQTERTKP